MRRAARETHDVCGTRFRATGGIGVGVVLLLSTLTFAASAAPPSSPFEIPHEKYQLSNGLEVILHRDPSLPMVAVNIWYHVGPANEPSGRSGFAHLFEHLMFEGSKYAGDQFDYLLESVGGTNMNGTTSWDRTNYYETVPAEQLGLALWLEADRMGFMIDTLTAEGLEVQREVVKNERRENYDNQPYGPSSLALYDALFPPQHPYHGAIIGSMEDLSRATISDVQAFFQEYYSPGNATLVLAGNFETTTTRALIDKYFGTLPARGPRIKPRRAQQPSHATRLEVVEDVQLAQLVYAWPVPKAFSAEEPSLELATQILGQGKASRLYQALVASGSCNSASASLDSNELASVLTVHARVASGKTIEEVEATIRDVLQRFAAEGPTADELSRAKTAIKLYYASQLQTLNDYGGEGGRAGLLQRFNHYVGDPGALPRWIQSHEAVTGEQLRSNSAAYLDPDRAIVLITRPGKPAAPSTDTTAATPASRRRAPLSGGQR